MTDSEGRADGQTTSRRPDGRAADELRPVRISLAVQKYPEGSTLIEVGDTHVLCSARVEERVPPFLAGQGKGWLSAEYAMLPGATHTRSARESSKGKLGGRTHEIQRLIGRSLRASLDLEALGERTIWIDCDVLQADGGTRTASITGAWVALVLALQSLHTQGKLVRPPLKTCVAAVSVGLYRNIPVLDLCYEEDHVCEVDMNVAMTRAGKFIEVQGTAERDPFSMDHLSTLLALAKQGITELIRIQEHAVKDVAREGLWSAAP